MISRALAFVLMGEVLGVFAAVFIGAMASGLLCGIFAQDPVVLGSVTTFVLVVSLCAAFWPAWSATDGTSRALRVI
jgi:hypothetical protein